MPPKSLPTAFQSRISTRSSNKNAHPGQGHTKYDNKKRSPAEIQAERTKKEEEKQAKKQQMTASIARVAEIEDHQHREDAKRKVGDEPSMDGSPAFRPPQAEATPSLKEPSAKTKAPSRKSNKSRLLSMSLRRC